MIPAQGRTKSFVSMGPGALAHKREGVVLRKKEPKDNRTVWSAWALGKGVLTLADPPLAMDGCLAGVPCLLVARSFGYPDLDSCSTIVLARMST